jgi:hypothetical protein
MQVETDSLIKKEFFMPVTLTITGSSIGELEQQLSELKAQLVASQPQGAVNGVPPAPGTPTAPPTVTQQLQRQMTSLKTQSASTSGKTWLMLHTIAQHFPGQFNLDDVRRQMGVPAGHVKAWRRNVGRWSKRTGVVIFQHVAGTHHPTEFEMPTDLRHAVVQIGP